MANIIYYEYLWFHYLAQLDYHITLYLAFKIVLNFELNAMRINKLVEEAIDRSYKKIKNIKPRYINSSECCSECESECSMCCEHHHS